MSVRPQRPRRAAAASQRRWRLGAPVCGSRYCSAGQPYRVRTRYGCLLVAIAAVARCSREQECVLSYLHVRRAGASALRWKRRGVHVPTFADAHSHSVVIWERGGVVGAVLRMQALSAHAS